MEQEFSVWDSACDLLRNRLSKDVYDRWIAVIRPVSLKNRKLVLSVANDFYLSWLEEHYLPLIREALGLLTGATRPGAIVTSETEWPDE